MIKERGFPIFLHVLNTNAIDIFSQANIIAPMSSNLAVQTKSKREPTSGIGFVGMVWLTGLDL